MDRKHQTARQICVKDNYTMGPYNMQKTSTPRPLLEGTACEILIWLSRSASTYTLPSD